MRALCPQGVQRGANPASSQSCSMMPKFGVAKPMSTSASASARGLSSLLLPSTARVVRQWSAAAAGRQLSARCMSVAATAATPASSRYSPVKEAHGFKLEREMFIKEYDSQVMVYKHEKTGAELISVANADENKTFGVVFRTPVDDSTGIPHILEHSVLCGSRKYPIKEPFVELMKGSLNTFLNAFTYPDRTCYPVASTNLQDFYNLVDVYMDAVFHPRCIRDPAVFQQEGWHYELDAPQDPLTFKGVVFNEMKGVYSQPDSIFYRAVQHALFPHNTYRHDSGGDPTAIPSLTFEQFKDFHAKYYHPSNARFWFYGDDDPVERMKLLDSFLGEFERKEVSSAVVTQPLLSEPRRVVDYYAAGDSEEGEQKAFVAVNWVLTDTPLDTETELALGFLNYLMLGTNASPLRKALNDSGLGAAVIGGGIDDELKQPVFSLGLKGVAQENVDQVEELVLQQLSELRTTGFTPTAIEAAINTIEFALRENNTGSFPRGLSLMLRAVGAWIYDRDPLVPLQWEEALKSFKAKLSSGQDVFGPLLDKFLLANKHRVTVVLLPDSELGARIEGEEAARLQAKRESMADGEIQAVVAATHDLKLRQETPDSPEALSCVPTLKLSDIPTTITKVPTDVTQLPGGSKLLTHDMFTNNVVYMEAALDMRSVPAHLLPLIPLFCRSLTNMGTDKESFVELTERMGRKTGGLSVYPFTSAVRGKAEPIAYIMLRGKAMADKTGDLCSLATDILTTARLDDRARFTQMVAETKAALESGIIGSGHSFAAKRLSAQRSTAGWLGEQMGGLSYLEYIRSLSKRVEGEWEGVQADLEAIRTALLSRSGAIVNLTADAATLSAAEPHVRALLDSLPQASPNAAAAWSGSLARVNEALVVPTQVNYVGKSANLYADADYKLSGSAYVIEKYLGNTWLWDKVRVVGGAYGGFCSFDSHSGNFTYLSYRDPNLLETVEAYDGSPEFLRSLDLTQDEITKAIIGTIGDVDAYQLPDAKGYAALSRHLLGVTDEERQARREQILGTSNKDFRAFAEVLECVRGEASRVVAVTSAERAAAANAERGGAFWEVRRVL